MNTAEAGTRASDSPIGVLYDGFLSYSHAADDLLAPRLQAGLQRFAKPWWKRRALRVFRDDASLSANPHLWSSITEALDRSGWFILLLSPDAAESPWVNREIGYWLEHKDPARMIPVLTDGDFGWANGDIVSDAAPAALYGAFADEPRWVDVRFARSAEQLDLKNPRFSGAVADIASAVREVPKDELESEEVKQHRRTIRTAWAAGVVVVLLGLAATAAAIFAFNQQGEAQQQAEIAQQSEQTAVAEADRAVAAEEAESQQRAVAESEAARAEQNAAVAKSRELASAAVSVLGDDPELSMLLALESIAATPADTAISPSGVLVLRDAMQANRLLQRFSVPEGQNFARISSDGTTVFHSSGTTRQVVAFDVATGAVQWTYHDPTTIGTFRRRRVGLSPDEELVTVQIFDIPLVQDESVAVDAEGNDENPARIVVLRASDGEVVRVLEPGACRFLNAWGNGFSRDGQWFAVFTGTGGCFDDPDADWVTVYDTSTWEEAYRLQIDGAFGEEAVFSEDSSRVLLYGGGRPTELRSFPEMELINRLDESAMAALSPDGQKVVQSFSIVVVSRPLIVDAETGERIGFLESVDDFLSLDPLSFSPDGTKIAATTHGADFVFDAEDGRMLAKLGERGFTFSHSFTEDGSMLLTATETALLLWDLGGGLDELGVPIEPADVEAVWINPNQVADGPNLAVRLLFPDENGEILDSRVVTALLDPETGQVRDQVSGFGVQLPDGRFFVSRQRTGQDGERVIGPVVIWDPASDSFVELTDCAAPESAIDQISEIDCPGGKPFYGANDWFFGSVVAALDGSFFAAESYAPVGSERSIRVWDGETLDVRSEFEVPRSQHVTAAGAGWLGTFDSDLFGWLTVYDVDSGAVLAEPSKATDRPFWVYAVAPDGSLLYAADLEGSVWVFDTFSWETVATWEAHDARHRGLALSPEGTRLVTTGEDDFVKVWDVSRIRDRSSVTEPLPLLDRIPAPFPSDAAWLSADRLAVFLGNDANWLEVSLSIDELVTSARQRLTRGFTEGECANYQIDDPCPTTLEAIQSGSA